jgi:hypothetical protein
VLLRARDYMVMFGDNTVGLDLESPVAQQLLTGLAPPEGFELLKTVLLEINAGGETAVFARLYRIHPLETREDNAPPNSAGETPVSQLSGSAGAL